ncbi:hypothetical protein GDO78_015132 [Eleutherodactylus coqui]|uniref:Uncharacterized protein n=1 Tax=Eleutherodactylus coqui TaxID=57060 RepID=A0A8J6JWX4_ELECQ|nr:hypothetical protein GDO78_015132 [Eleutherodactylus coqui]
MQMLSGVHTGGYTHMQLLSSVHTGGHTHMQMLSGVHTGGYTHIKLLSSVHTGGHTHMQMLSGVHTGGHTYIQLLSAVHTGGHTHMQLLSGVHTGGHTHMQLLSSVHTGGHTHMQLLSAVHTGERLLHCLMVHPWMFSSVMYLDRYLAPGITTAAASEVTPLPAETGFYIAPQFPHKPRKLKLKNNSPNYQEILQKYQQLQRGARSVAPYNSRMTTPRAATQVTPQCRRKQILS